MMYLYRWLPHRNRGARRVESETVGLVELAKAAKRDKARARRAETRLDFRDTKSGDRSTHWFPFAVVTSSTELED